MAFSRSRYAVVAAHTWQLRSFHELSITPVDVMDHPATLYDRCDKLVVGMKAIPKAIHLK